MRSAVGLLAALALAACQAPAPAAPEGTRRTGLSGGPEDFQDARTTLRRLTELRGAQNATGARALAPSVLATGRRLAAMERPETLRREDVARFLELRARFIDALNAFDRAAASTDDATLWGAAERLESSFWAWVDASQGVPAEGAV